MDTDELTGQFLPQDSGYALQFERHFNHPVASVWRAITDSTLVRQWFPADISGGWNVGDTLTFTFLHGEGDGMSEEELSGKVLLVEAPKRLEFTWHRHRFAYELAESEGGCTLRFTAGFDDKSIGARDAAGWEFCFANLDLVLEGQQPEPFDVNRWTIALEHYRSRFEPVAGPQQGMPEDHPRA